MISSSILIRLESVFIFNFENITINNVICVYYIVINLVAFYFMWYDKQCAIKNKWRINESTLFTLCLLGGVIGFYAGMHIFHHKTKKIKFHFVFLISTILHGFILYYIYFKN